MVSFLCLKTPNFVGSHAIDVTFVSFQSSLNALFRWGTMHKYFETERLKYNM